MSSLGIWHWLIILAVVVLIFGTRRIKGIDDVSSRSQRYGELSHIPVYSAETTSGKEAGFIRDRLPRRVPTVVVLVFVVIFGAVAWWLMR